ncbi:unnamed protein product [Didymodactylos carnosus]|uniref:Rap-GAP domain-containing protein n=1 Tax=Didymodactylos carnosus TaxID=1234261 RepID=A0A8S2CRN3_9BILA|nr:unnamed protein product [Didymodactylos carnosus]CAF3496887.1 unnamed protein product [Didymodactylos carnosus]
MTFRFRCSPFGLQQSYQHHRHQMLAPALNRSYSLDLPSYTNYNNNNNNNVFYRPSPNIIQTNSHQLSDSQNQQLPTMGVIRQTTHSNDQQRQQIQQQRDHPKIKSANTNQQLCQKLSTRSSCSVFGDYDNTSEQQIQNSEIIHSRDLVCRSSSYAMIYTPPGNDDYLIEGDYSNDSSHWSMLTKISPADYEIDCDNVSQIYNNDFYEQFHLNLYAIDEDLNPIVMSVKRNEEPSSVSIIVRTKESSKYAKLLENNSDDLDYSSYCEQIYPNIKTDHFQISSSLSAAQYVKGYDEKLETRKFKFGVIYQRRGQTTEEEFFNNEKHGPALDEFRAGLDTSGKTDTPTSYYELYENKEIMFHVSTLLPFTSTDRQQVQRKRHIGNDIVTIIFQEESTPFHPSMICSNFLHAFLVVQPVYNASKTCYKITLVTRRGIEPFNPILQNNCVYPKSADYLKSFILTKLINAEYACYRCRTFSLLQERTRCSYLKTLCENLTTKSYDMLCDEYKSSQRRSSVLSNSVKKRYFSSMRKIFGRSHSTPDGRISTSATSSKPLTSTLSNESETNEKDRRKNSKKLSRTPTHTELPDEITIPEPLRSPISVSDEQDLTNKKNSVNRKLTRLSDESLTSSDTPYDHRPQMYYEEESDEGLDIYRQQLRLAEKKNDAYIRPLVYNSWHRTKSSPQTTGIHISEEAATV